MLARRPIIAGIAGLAILAGASQARAAQTLSNTAPKAVLVPIEPTLAQRSALVAAKSRPTALQLRTLIRQSRAKQVNLAAIDKSLVPVMVSARPELVQDLRIFAAPNRYTASARNGSIAVEINGTRLPAKAPKNFALPRLSPTFQQNLHTPAPGQDPADAGAIKDVVISRTEYGVDVSFSRFGSVYNLSIACDDPAHDPACTDENAAKTAAEMEVIGGGEVNP
jgi:hypothetical protein